MKNANIGYIFFKLNCDFYPKNSYKEDSEKPTAVLSTTLAILKLRPIIKYNYAFLGALSSKTNIKQVYKN